MGAVIGPGLGVSLEPNLSHNVGSGSSVEGVTKVVGDRFVLNNVNRLQATHQLNSIDVDQLSAKDNCCECLINDCKNNDCK